MDNEHYKELDELYYSISKFFNKCNKSIILQNFFLNVFESFFYATLINNFFINLNQKNIKENNLPKGQIGKIKSKYKNIQRDVKSALALSLKYKKIDEIYYNSFKIKIETDFPGFQKVIFEIEKEIEFEKAKKYLEIKEEEIKNVGKTNTDFNASILTTILEVHIQNDKCLPFNTNFSKLINTIIKESFPKLSHELFKSLNENSEDVLDNQRTCQNIFENRLYERWKIPLNLLEYLIGISIESGYAHMKKLRNSTENISESKQVALIKIHARASQISNEILVLLKSGYADGATARWRSLHELAVISFFLLHNNNNVAKRYLEHEIIKTFKEAKDYRAYYKELRYPPIEIK